MNLGLTYFGHLNKMISKETIYNKPVLSKKTLFKRADWLIKLGLWEQVLIECSEQQGFEFKKIDQHTLMLYQYSTKHVSHYIGFIRYV